MYRVLSGLVICLCALSCIAEDGFSWQLPQAKVVEMGDLEWAPREFVFKSGDTVRYIDYENGEDSKDGTTRAAAWKHHPWDANASDTAAAFSGAATYIFKRGVVYRGFLAADDSGTVQDPIRLTSDPSWGEGAAVLAGSERIGGWKKAGATDVPDGMPTDGVWYSDIGTDCEPWAMWQVGKDGKVQRVHIARDPNWTLTNPADPKENWAHWTWPSRKHDSPIGKRQGVDEALKGKPKNFFEGVYCWSEWGGGIWGAMSLQYRSPVTDYDPERGAIDRVVISPIFDGWVVAGDRYFMEKHPSYLDSPGEFYYAAPTRCRPTAADRGFPWEIEWLPTNAEHAGRLYVRLNDDANPNEIAVEVAQRDQILRVLDQDHIEISGLTFSFVNVPYRPQHPDLKGWKDYDIHTQLALEDFDVPAAIILGGDTSHIHIANNRFHHLGSGITGKPWRSPRIKELPAFANLPNKPTDEFGEIDITDNDFQYLDHSAVDLRGRTDSDSASLDAPLLGRVGILRNRMLHISLRPRQSKCGPAIFLGGGMTLAEVAGNIIKDCYGMGIYTVGGKSGGDERTAPLIRVLIHHNRTDYCMTGANDWGQIAAWQGGPSYVYNNVASNAPGYHNHTWYDWDKKGPLPRYISNAYPFYGDGTYKSYWFNNIAWSDYDARTSKYRTQSPFMFVLGFQNYVFNNSAWNMNAGSNGSIGNRGGYLGNVFAHMNRRMISAGAKGDISVAGGGEDAVQLNTGAITTTAFTQNLLGDTLGAEQVVEIAGGGKRSDIEALAEQKPIVGDVGVIVKDSPFRQAEKHDFRPNADVTGKVKGVKFFVPWGLHATVGEWQFRHNPQTDPQVILGEHFYMTDEYVHRNMYYEVPRGDLIAPGATAATYVPGPLTDWVKNGAMHFDGKNTFAMIAHERLVTDYPTTRGFYDRKDLKNGSIRRTAGTPLKALREEVERLEEILANKGIKDSKKLEQEIEKKKRYIDDRTEREKELADELATLQKGSKKYTETKKTLDKISKRLAESRKELKDLEIKRVEGDKKMIAKLEQKLPKMKEELKKRQAEGQPDEFAYPGRKRQTLNIATGNLLIEAFFRTKSGHTAGVIAGKMGTNGYQLGIDPEGRPEFELAAGGKRESFSGAATINDGDWHHVIAEIDRATGRVGIYVDGAEAGKFSSKLAPTASMANTSDFLVGRGVDGGHFAGDMNFLRVCRGTLADARTTIEELYAWQFVDGPHLKDFAGRPRDFNKTAPGAIDYQ